MAAPPPTDLRGLDRLDALVTQLRAPDGCPWDRKQRLSDLRAYLLEEAHEVASALDAVAADAPGPSRAMDELADELGDLLFQIVFISRLATEHGAFDLERVVSGIFDKMVRRHPHVFGPSAQDIASGHGEDGSLSTAEAVQEAWEARKVRQGESRSLLAGVPLSMPALLSAYRITQKAAGVGFEWPDRAGVLAKVREELGELEEAIEAYDAAASETAAASPQPTRDHLREEVGDLLFTLANVARSLDIDPEAALAQTNAKFRRRFGYIEDRLRDQGRTVVDANLEEMDGLWNQAKTEERT